MKYLLPIIITLVVTCLPAYGQIRKPDRDMIGFFSGTWTGAGEFASGKKIAATITIQPTLDSAWLSVDHVDQAPNTYKATSLWGVDGAGCFTATTFDNTGGRRTFSGNGWQNNKLLLTTFEYQPKYGLVFQHFLYEKLSPTSFKMTYEVSRDAIHWQMGDYLIFQKVDPRP